MCPTLLKFVCFLKKKLLFRPLFTHRRPPLLSLLPLRVTPQDRLCKGAPPSPPWRSRRCSRALPAPPPPFRRRRGSREAASRHNRRRCLMKRTRPPTTLPTPAAAPCSPPRREWAAAEPRAVIRFSPPLPSAALRRDAAASRIGLRVD